MKSIIYCIYYAGVIVFGLSTNYLDLIPALVTTVAAPFILLQLAEMTGRVKIMSAPQPTTPIEISSYEGLSDEQSIRRFGWALITEMDQCIADTVKQLETMQKSREEMVEMYKKDGK